MKNKLIPFGIPIHKPLVVFFARRGLEFSSLFEKVKENHLNVIFVDTVDDFIHQITSKDIMMTVLEDAHIQKCSSDRESLYRLLTISKIPVQIIVANKQKLSIYKHVEFDYIISENASFEEKLDEIIAFCNASKAMVAFEERTKSFSDFDLLEDPINEKVKEEIHNKNRKISALYMQILEYKKLLKKNFSDWQELEMPLNDKKIKKFHSSLKSNVLTANTDWESFSEHFVEVHPSFLGNLKKIGSTLSEENLRMCAYIKMGVGNHEIANYMNIQYDSVKRAQTRIKNRLSLPAHTTLRQYIRQLK